MEFIKKVVLTLALILFVISIFKDLTVGTIIQPSESVSVQDNMPRDKEMDNKDNEEKTENSFPDEQAISDRYTVTRIMIQPGDTVLTIIETINPNIPSMEITQLIEDFKTLNPGVNPHQIIPNESYLFPIYDN
ncbi:hypothetical protein [Aquibacillus salsiterrae]|uniref:LysM domain-containing protein n=1 Tax=Aquibacillus salsiterrae TaxID=2950439 RepID=A0A9X3WC19_9BACI|nr:hypothetical protein [Aquibacillus salsiterrae]MDC3415536.1 hypothetical protein [Aquibacillus salsiterrae]